MLADDWMAEWLTASLLLLVYPSVFMLQIFRPDLQPSSFTAICCAVSSTCAGTFAVFRREMGQLRF